MPKLKANNIMECSKIRIVAYVEHERLFVGTHSAVRQVYAIQSATNNAEMMLQHHNMHVPTKQMQVSTQMPPVQQPVQPFNQTATFNIANGHANGTAYPELTIPQSISPASGNELCAYTSAGTHTNDQTPQYTQLAVAQSALQHIAPPKPQSSAAPAEPFVYEQFNHSIAPFQASEIDYWSKCPVTPHSEHATTISHNPLAPQTQTAAANSLIHSAVGNADQSIPIAHAAPQFETVPTSQVNYELAIARSCTPNNTNTPSNIVPAVAEMLQQNMSSGNNQNVQAMLQPAVTPENRMSAEQQRVTMASDVLTFNIPTNTYNNYVNRPSNLQQCNNQLIQQSLVNALPQFTARTQHLYQSPKPCTTSQYSYQSPSPISLDTRQRDGGVAPTTEAYYTAFGNAERLADNTAFTVHPIPQANSKTELPIDKEILNRHFNAGTIHIQNVYVMANNTPQNAIAMAQTDTVMANGSANYALSQTQGIGGLSIQIPNIANVNTDSSQSGSTNASTITAANPAAVVATPAANAAAVIEAITIVGREGELTTAFVESAQLEHIVGHSADNTSTCTDYIATNAPAAAKAADSTSFGASSEDLGQRVAAAPNSMPAKLSLPPDSAKILFLKYYDMCDIKKDKGSAQSIKLQIHLPNEPEQNVEYSILCTLCRNDHFYTDFKGIHNLLSYSFYAKCGTEYKPDPFWLPLPAQATSLELPKFYMHKTSKPWQNLQRKYEFIKNLKLTDMEDGRLNINCQEDGAEIKDYIDKCYIACMAFKCHNGIRERISEPIYVPFWNNNLIADVQLPNSNNELDVLVKLKYDLPEEVLDNLDLVLTSKSKKEQITIYDIRRRSIKATLKNAITKGKLKILNKTFKFNSMLYEFDWKKEN